MTKGEFLNDLEKRLQVLSEQERTDILEEYAQHIELKMANGQMEQEAIGDFGDMEELVSEILDAYHVNPDYGKKENQMPEKVQHAAKEAGSHVKTWLQKAGAACRNLWNALCRSVRKLRQRTGQLLGNLFQRFCQRTDEISGTDGTGDADRGSGFSAWRNKMAVKRRKRASKEDSKMKEMLYEGGCRFWQGVRKLLFLCWTLMVIICLSPVAVTGFFALMMLGLLLVGVFLGYPLAGTALLTLGTMTGCFALVWFLWILLFRRGVQKKAAVAFGAGLLLTGIGCGVAFAEFASFQYMGEKMIGEEQIETKTFELSVPEEEHEVWFHWYPYEGMEVTRAEDAQMQPGEIVVEVTCNTNFIEPEVVQVSNEIFLEGYGRSGSFGEIMKYKDELLNCLKNRQVYEWKTSTIQKVVIRGNAQTLEKIQS